MAKAPGTPRLKNLMPGPDRRGKLPPTLPAGQLPSDDERHPSARLWYFTSKAIKAGENYIQDDTREWFDDQDRTVVIGRHYPTHPRWYIGPETMRGRVNNQEITAEIHMLARVTAGLSDLPAWIPARMTVKQVQADASYRFVKLLREEFIRGGKEAMTDFRARSPGQFLKMVMSATTPKQIEQNVTITPGSAMDVETADHVLQMLAAELERREQDAKTLTLSPLDYEPQNEPLAVVRETADELHAATGDDKLGVSREPGLFSASRLNRVVDLEADVVEQVEQTEEVEWD